MYHSILQFQELGIKKIEKNISQFMENEDMDIGDLVVSIGKNLQQLQCSLVAETLEMLDGIYVNDQYRKEKWNIIRRNDANSFMATCGQIHYSRTYFLSKETGERVYLADRAAGITPHMRISDDVTVKVLEQAVDCSYRKSGEDAVLTEDSISKHAVMKQVHELEIPQIEKNVAEKKRKRILYINADEDHVALQFHQKKGDLGSGKDVKKHNTVMPRLIYVYDGVERESPGSKRNCLTGKYHFGGVSGTPAELWEEVAAYIEEHYDTDYLEKVYIIGDGASWIKTGVDIIGKSIFVLDRFHLEKYINKAVSHLLDSRWDAKQEIYDAFSLEDKKGLKETFRKIENVTGNESKRKSVLESRRYLLNQWEGIVIRNGEPEAELCCSAEGHVSHVLSARLSSRPMGWSREGADKMSRLRIYHRNGGKIYDLVKYRKEKQKREIEERVREHFEGLIRHRRKSYYSANSGGLPVTQAGKTTTLYRTLKAIRAVC